MRQGLLKESGDRRLGQLLLVADLLAARLALASLL